MTNAGEPQMAEESQGGVTLVQVFGEFREFRGAMSTRMEAFERELRDGLGEITDAVDGHTGDGADLAKRVTIVEARQAMVYKILGAIGLVALGIGGELVRRAFTGGP